MRSLFTEPDVPTYVDWAGVALPLRESVSELQLAVSRWASGTLDWGAEFEPAGEVARGLIAALVGVEERAVALMPAVSVATAVVLDGLAPGSTVLVPEEEFASVLLPVEDAARRGRLAVRRAPFERLADAVDQGVSLIATSLVRSDGGGLLDVDGVAAAAQRHGARLYLDVTHAAGVLDLPRRTQHADYVAAAAYKHLLCPRGVAFLTLPEDDLQRRRPVASWRGLRPGRSYYGATCDDLHDDARGLDVSLAWFSWMGALPALRLLAAGDPVARERHCVGLADAAAGALGARRTGSSVFSVALAPTGADGARLLEDAGIRASIRAGSVRLSFHLANDHDDVTRLVQQLEPHVRRQR